MKNFSLVRLLQEGVDCSGTVHVVIDEVDNLKTGLNRSRFTTCVASVTEQISLSRGD